MDSFPWGATGRTARIRTRVIILAVALAGVLITTHLTGGHSLMGPLSEPSSPLDIEVETSVQMLDRHGRLLRAFSVGEGRWRLPVSLGEVDPTYLAMLLDVEDRRYRQHSGVDVLALSRAGWQLLSAQRIRSGGSTLSMQTARLLDGGSTRNLSGKLKQIRQALWLEQHLDKDAILAIYLTLAPFGGNLEGVRAGSLAWLGKEPRRLSQAEAALLIALPQSPEARRPDRNPEAARLARDRVLAHVHLSGLIDADELAAARAEPVPTRRHPAPMLAPHLTERLKRAHPGESLQRLTIDAALQARLERLASERASSLDPNVSVAILVADHTRGELLASIGSAGLFTGPRQGHVDMTRALRSPGSTLKPLIYGLAFEDGRAHPESLIEDRPTAFGSYVPANFDRGFQGTVTIRQALQLSLNIPAVVLLEMVGPARLVARLRSAGALPQLPDASPPGLAVGLGGVGLSLIDLVRLYAAIARGGEALVIREHLRPPAGGHLPDDESASGRPVLDARAAWSVASILAEAPAPTHSLTGRIAFKTGTSYGYRDAWALGFDGRHVVGVWVGRPDGAPVPGLAGIDAAAPVLHEVFARLGPITPLPPAPAGILHAQSGDLPPPLRHVQGAREPSAGASSAPEIAYPPAGARVDLGLAEGEGAPLLLKVRHGVPPFVWLANGVPTVREPYARTARWTPPGPGFASISVIDALGRSARVHVFLE